jgi:hypothetical protein
VLDFEALEKSTMAYVFFRIANLNNDYPMVENLAALKTPGYWMYFENRSPQV